MIKFHQGKYMNYYDVSVKEEINLEKPFLWIAQKLFQDNQLEFKSRMPVVLHHTNL
jgi:hypothetical protein